jgi:heme-degrading monooxygenase HmoA
MEHRMIITIFRSRLRPEHQAEYGKVAERIHELGTQMPGFLSIKTYTADDGERVSIVAFASQKTHDAWRNHLEHREAQRLGREKFYSEFTIQVCEVIRESRFPDLG